jgi:hypothetical protein
MGRNCGCDDLTQSDHNKDTYDIEEAVVHLHKNNIFL